MNAIVKIENQTPFIEVELSGKVQLGVGWSDGVSEPVLTGSDVELPETRTWSHFEAIVRKGSPVFAVDAMVNHTIPMKRQTTVTEEFKVTP